VRGALVAAAQSRGGQIWKGGVATRAATPGGWQRAWHTVSGAGAGTWTHSRDRPALVQTIGEIRMNAA
jgi:hypothetical protein